MNALSKPAVSGDNLEASALALFDEWLKRYFDKAAHGVAGTSFDFPKAEIYFQVANPTQPLPVIAISVVWVKDGRKQIYWTRGQRTEDRGQRVQEVWMETFVQFFVRCGHAGAADPRLAVQGNEEKQAQVGAALLHKILEDPASTLPLASKGLHKFRPQNPVPLPAAITDGRYATRLITCRCRAHYFINPQGG